MLLSFFSDLAYNIWRSQLYTSCTALLYLLTVENIHIQIISTSLTEIAGGGRFYQYYFKITPRLHRLSIHKNMTNILWMNNGMKTWQLLSEIGSGGRPGIKHIKSLFILAGKLCCIEWYTASAATQCFGIKNLIRQCLWHDQNSLPYKGYVVELPNNQVILGRRPFKRFQVTLQIAFPPTMLSFFC